MRKFVALVFLIFGIQSAYGQQIREFSIDTSEFIVQFANFMDDVNEDEEYLLDRFLSLWTYDSISNDQKISIMEASNHMLRRRARPSPTFVNY
ncbi:MAG: hypothetical protein ACOCUP_03555, partial [bacterium]